MDLPAIKSKYAEIYGRNLKEDVSDDTSGDYKKLLLKIIDKVGEGKKTKTQPKSETAKTQQKPEVVKKEENNNVKSKKEEKSKIKDKPKKELEKNKNEEDSDKETDEDAVKLYKAMTQSDTNKDDIIEVITRNSNAERQTLKKRYNELYNKVSHMGRDCYR